MKTKVSTAKKEVIISHDGPTILIGERINPTGRKKLLEALQAGNFDVVTEEAESQVNAGADILDVNVAGTGIEERTVLPKVVEAVMGRVDVPICIDFNDIAALEATLRIYEGKPIVNSVTAEEKSMKEVLPLVKEYGAAVIGLALDDEGIPKTSDRRIANAAKIVERAESMGIPREDVIIDGLALTIGSDDKAAQVTLETVSAVKRSLGVNQTLGASNISFGLPNRILLNQIFLAIAISVGLTCPTVDAAKMRSTAAASDLCMGRDRYALRYIQDYRRAAQA